jgi:hypothetical protein
MSGISTSKESSQAPTTAPSSPPDLPPRDSGLDEEIRKLKEEDRKARAANKQDEVKRQKKNLAIRRKRAQQESAADRETKAKQLESLLAKSAVSGRPA